ncbi:uncharacterized protein LOC124353204 isoform X2 [Homalodisca vitripennis]|uniref:uncharacterized protein LOC124353204 isoform X2 n=1 Tax=Homalodisca vitripennis TaxID=197043 RepID=UPI001EEA8814|nr:uncharacterized protein LOC124353204 isoform X2 [Homalodisca vitripennis]
MGSGVVLVCVVVSACAALDYSLGPVIPESQYGDEDALQKQSDQDTMEYMDDLKEELDTSITPLSEMNSDVSVDITKRPSKTKGKNWKTKKNHFISCDQRGLQRHKKTDEMGQQCE